jgi:hypothetical protein
MIGVRINQDILAIIKIEFAQIVPLFHGTELFAIILVKTRQHCQLTKY